MTLVEIVFLAGAQCLSPLEQGQGLTEVAKVPCAVLIQIDPATSDVDIVPPAAATDPAVIAMLVKPRPGDVAAKSDRAPLAGDITGSIGRAPRIVPASAEPDAQVPQAKPARVTKKHSVASAGSRRLCGSQRTVWYVNKDGRKKYRCVRSG